MTRETWITARHPPGPAAVRIITLRGDVAYDRCAREGVDPASFCYQLLSLDILDPDLSSWRLTELAFARARRQD